MSTAIPGAIGGRSGDREVRRSRMYPSPARNLLSFLGAEHENELVSTDKHARDLDMLSQIDGLFRRLLLTSMFRRGSTR